MMNRKTTVVGILSALIIAGSPATASAQEYEQIPDGFTFEVEGSGITIITDGNTARQGAKAVQTEEKTDLATYATEVIHLTNLEREKAGLEPLVIDETLMRMAKTRAGELLRSYSHTRPDGSRCFTVFDDFGCELLPMDENIAKGQKTPEKAVAAWMASTKGHREGVFAEDGAHAVTDNFFDRVL